MSKSASKPKKKPISVAKSYPISGALCLVFTILMVVAFYDYSPGQSSWITTSAVKPSESPSNLVGTFGVSLTFWLYYILGALSWFIPTLLVGLAGMLFFKRTYLLNAWRYLAVFFLFISGCSLFSLVELDLLNPGWVSRDYFPNGIGGWIGYQLLARAMEPTLGFFGSFLATGTLFGFALIITYSVEASPVSALIRFNNGLVDLYYIVWPKLQALGSQVFGQLKAGVQKPEKLPMPKLRPIKKAATEKTNAVKIDLPEPEAKKEKKSLFAAATQAAQSSLKIFDTEKPEKAKNATIPTQKGDYNFPPIELLDTPPQGFAISNAEHQEIVERLIQTLAEFGVNVTPGEVHTGPVVTRYEVTPAPGVRVEKIQNLDKNIALALKAHSVRILAPVPGKGSVGIEIPNQRPAPVCIREIIESTAWADSSAEIPIVLGKEVTGRPLVYDLTKMPHLLIAGSTGSGKTVCINTIIASLLYKATPSDLRFIMVDPKIVEMQLYNDLPHMLIPVVTAPKKVPAALKWLIREMERRYQIFATVGVRNIAGFNAKILKDKKEKEKAQELDANLSPEERAAMNTIEVPRTGDLEIPTDKLPYIVCIIDELADLMMVAPADIETCIARLAQLARAAGIHLIIATQRPSVNVITGVIKANLPSRIAFKVASKVDSRTILDVGGADQLIGRGDMLFLPPGTSNMMRAQGAFASDDEINRILDALKKNGPPDYADDVQREIETSDSEESTEEEESNWDDKLVPDAWNIIRSTKRASTSMLQRRLKIGYNRAARIMELLEAEGYVGSENGSSPREILKELD